MPAPPFLLLALALASSAPADEPSLLLVPPGSVVRWEGPGLLVCQQGERRWEPAGGACLYPIDLAATGELELIRRSTGGVAARRVKIGDYPYPTQRLEVEEKYVAPSAADLERIARERERVTALWTLDTPRRWTLPLGPPLADLPAAGRFGARRIFNGEPRSPHSGADFAARRGTVVRAVADGRVVLAEEHYFAGKGVYIDHGDGLVSMSFHLDEIVVSAGDEVRRGETIGSVGATGRVTGPHLHFAVRWRGARVDPEILFGRLAMVEIR